VTEEAALRPGRIIQLYYQENFWENLDDATVGSEHMFDTARSLVNSQSRAFHRDGPATEILVA